MKTLLFLDDLRNPFLDKEGKIDNSLKQHKIIWVRSFEEFKDYLLKYDMPDAISFDHDLHEEHYTPEFFWNNYDLSKKYQDIKKLSYQHKTGEYCAKFLLSHCRRKKIKEPKIYIHSDNPVGVNYIENVFKVLE